MAKKRQKSFFERLTEKNDKHDESQRKVQTKQSKRKKGIIAILLALGIGVTASIAIPLGVTLNKVNYINAANDSENVLTIQTPNGKNTNITVGTYTNDITNANDKNAKEISDVEKKMVFYLYNKEYLASIQYQNIYNNSLEPGESTRNDIQLQSITDIKNQQQKKLDDIKQNYIKQYGYENWEVQFTKALSSDPQYGGAINEKQAVDYLTYSAIKTKALARFKPSFQVISKSKITRTAKRTIYKLDENGNIAIDPKTHKKIVLFEQGQVVNNYLVENKNFYYLNNDPNSAEAFITNSYDSQYDDPTNLINQYFDNNQQYIVNKIQLPGIMPSLSTNPFTLDDTAKEKFILLNSYYVISDPNDATKIKVVPSYQIINDLKPIKDYFISPTVQKLSSDQIQAMAKSRANYQNFLKNLTLTNTPYGISGIQSLNQVFADNTTIGMGVVANSLFNDENNIPSISLQKIFAFDQDNSIEKQDSATNDKYTKLLAAVNQAVDASKQDVNDITQKVVALNQFISNYIKNLNSVQFDDLIRQRYNNILSINRNNNSLYSYVYKISDMNNAFLVLDSKGTYIIRTTQINNLNDFTKFIEDDLQSVANGAPEVFKIADAISGYQTDNRILQTMLNDPDFITYLKSQNNPNADKQNQNYTDADITNIKNANNLIVLWSSLSNNFNTYNNASYNFVNQELKSGNSYNFAVANGEAKFILNWGDSDSTPTYADGKAQDYIYNQIKTLLQQNNSDPTPTNSESQGGK